MKKIALVVPWFGPFRIDYGFWSMSVKYNPSVDFILFTDQEINAPSNNVKIIETNLAFIEKLAKDNIWGDCIISKPYKLCDYKPAYGDLFHDYLKGYDFWGHCDIDLVFGDIRKFITDDILEKYDRIGVDGPFTLYRNTHSINALYRKIGDYKRIFVDQQAWGFDEWGRNSTGTSPYWIKNLGDRLWCEKVFDNLAPYHYSFVSGAVRNSTLDIKNLMFCFDNGKLYRYGTLNGKLVKHESLYVHLQKRPICIKTKVESQFSIIPPGNYVPFIKSVTQSYL